MERKVMIYRILWSALRLDAATKVGLVDVITLEDHKSALADAQAQIESLQRERDELKELTSVICGHCCEPMAIPSRAVLQAALDAEREKVKGLEAKVELQETAVRCAGHALDESRETHNRQAAKIREQQEQLSTLQGLMETIKCDLFDRYDGAPDSPTRWMGSLIRDIEIAQALPATPTERGHE